MISIYKKLNIQLISKQGHQMKSELKHKRCCGSDFFHLRYTLQRVFSVFTIRACFALYNLIFRFQYIKRPEHRRDFFLCLYSILKDKMQLTK